MMKTIKYAEILVLLLAVGSAMNAEIRVSSAEALKAAVRKPQPEYPLNAKLMRVSGQVVADVTIAADGSVEDVKVTSGHPLLGPPVVSAVKTWKFTPFMQNGEPSKAIASLSFEFRM